MTNIITLSFLFGKDEGDEKRNRTTEVSEEADASNSVATINGSEVHYQDWLLFLEENYGEEALEKLIDREVIRQLADGYNLTVNPGVIDLELAYLTTVLDRLSEEDVESVEQTRRETIEHRLLTEMFFTKDIVVTDAEIETYFNTYRSQFQYTPRIELSHIVVKDAEAAERVIQELDNGAEFQSLAYEYTLDEETRALGGYLGFYSTDTQNIPYGYLDQANKLEEFSYGEPFLGNGGYIILYLHRTIPAIDLDYSQAKDYIRTQLAGEEIEEVPDIKSLWDELEVTWPY